MKTTKEKIGKVELTVYLYEGKEYVKFTRVSYGKKDTPEEQKDYRIDIIGFPPVGTRKEIKEFMIRSKKEYKAFQKYAGVALVDEQTKKELGEIEITFILTGDL